MINDELDVLVRELPMSTLREAIGHVLSSPGKRVRPLILLFSSQAFGGDTARSMNAALAVELVHAASLVHDDILDEGIERRGAPTTVERYGTDAALLCGDYLISRSIELISWYRQPVISAFSSACMEMSEGELLDISRKHSKDEYYRCIYKKTASLFAASAKIGCLIAGAQEEDINCLERYGMHLGLAYQIVDDLREMLGLDHGKKSVRRSVTLPGIYGEKYSLDATLELCTTAVSDNCSAAKNALKIAGGDLIMKDRLSVVVDLMTMGLMKECKLQKSLS